MPHHVDTRKMATTVISQLLLLAAASAFVAAAAAGDDAHAPVRPALAEGPALVAPTTAPLAATEIEGLGWTPAHANGAATGFEAAVLGRHRRGACTHAGHCCTRRVVFAFGGRRAGPVGGVADVRAWGLVRMVAVPRRGLEPFAAHHPPHPRARGHMRVRGGGTACRLHPPGPHPLAPTLSLVSYFFAACPPVCCQTPAEGGGAAAAHG